MFDWRLCFWKVKNSLKDNVWRVHVLLGQLTHEGVEEKDIGWNCVLTSKQHHVYSYLLGVQHSPEVLKWLWQKNIHNKKVSLQKQDDYLSLAQIFCNEHLVFLRSHLWLDTCCSLLIELLKLIAFLIYKYIIFLDHQTYLVLSIDTLRDLNRIEEIYFEKDAFSILTLEGTVELKLPESIKFHSFYIIPSVANPFPLTINSWFICPRDGLKLEHKIKILVLKIFQLLVKICLEEIIIS